MQGGAKDVGLILRVQNGNPLQYSCLEHPMDRGAWWATVCSCKESDVTECVHAHANTHTHVHTHTCAHTHIPVKMQKIGRSYLKNLKDSGLLMSAISPFDTLVCPCNKSTTHGVWSITLDKYILYQEIITLLIVAVWMGYFYW